MQLGDIVLSLAIMTITLIAFLRYDYKVKKGMAEWEDINPYRNKNAGETCNSNDEDQE